MFRPLVRSHRRPPRRGTAILITCFFLLTIMMVTALALVMYAAREKAAALAYQDGAAVPTRTAPPPDNTFNQFLGALIYDAGDGDLANGSAVDPNSRALQNALRGHSIARSMYGSRSDYSNIATVPFWAGNTTPWNGVGTFHEPASAYAYGTGMTPPVYPSLATIDRGQIVNYTGLQMDGQFLLVDPEWVRNRIATGSPLQIPSFAGSTAGRDYVSKAAGYTYPDLKNFFLGARDPATGEVIVQSFHRNSLFGSLDPSNGGVPVAQNNWKNDAGRVKTLRPRPIDHLKDTNGNPLFPSVPPNADGTYTGDVQNLPGAFVAYKDNSVTPPVIRFAGRNDSLWMHIGLAPITLSDGRRVQPLVAPLILPLDGSFDLSHHGNELGAPVVTSPGPPAVTANLHASHGGQGPWEINTGYGLIDRNAVMPLPLPLEAERFNLLAQRKNAPSLASREFNPYVNAQLPAAGQQQLLPRYAPVSWSGALLNFKLPSEQVAPDNRFMLGLPSSGDPSYSGGPFGNFQNDNGQIANHPAGYNSNEFGPRNNTTNLSSPVYPFTDLKRLSLRYAYYPDWYSQAFVTKTAPATFQGDGANFPYFANPTQSLQTKYRLDPAHARRGIFTPRTMGLDRPALAPTFLNRDTTSATAAVSMVTPTVAAGAPFLPGKPGSLIPIPGMGAPAGFPTPQAPGAVTDFAPTAGTTQQWYNYLAQFGSVNLNRPLADYRDLSAPVNMDTTKTPPVPAPQPLSAPGNMGNAVQAEADRQALARDIFVRLIIATGAAAQVNPSTGAVTLPDPNNNYALAGVNYTAQQYGVLRYLAQVAVNIVDYIDNDDISTTFVWNPTGDLTQDLNPANVGNRVVFGIEKPRLLLNEVYSEITNDPMDKIDGDPDPMNLGQNLPLAANAKAHVRFWAELVNATSAPHATATGVLGTGSVPLNAYQIQIARANRVTGGMEDRASFLSAPGNTNGRFGDASGAVTVPDATFTFPAAPMAMTPSTVSPNDVSLGAQQYAPAPANLPAGGFVLVGPKSQPTPKTGSKEFNPPTTGVWAPANKVDSPDPADAGAANTGMGYRLTMPAATALSTGEFKRHVVLLRRLTNPYLPVNDPSVAAPPYNPALPLNTYVTVDMMDYVPSFDAVHRAAAGKDNRGERPSPVPAGKNPEDFFDPVAERFAVGKVQPLAGLSMATVTNGGGKYNVYNGNNTYTVTSSLTASMVRDQTAAPTLTPGTDEPNEPKNTFGRHNGNGVTAPVNATVNNTASPATLTDTVQFPFDWMIHMDRPLETQGDMFFVRDCPPHRLTTEFVYPVVPAVATNPGLTYSVSSARWTYHSDGLARALELLTVKSPKLGDAHGGRVGGKVNPNVVQDSRVAQGVWDPQASNRFNLAFVTNTVWGGSGTGWMNSRSTMVNKTQADGATTNPVPVPSSSVQDLLAGGVDRPFMAYGGPTVPNGSTGQFAYTAPPATNDGDTIMRLDPTNATPYLHQTTESHPYTRTEPLRKVMNNLTPVSHTFVVYLTIGYFDVTLTTPANYPNNINGGQVPQFGAEVYDQIPGDMRQKYMAVIDMSNLALKPSFPAFVGDTDPHYDPNQTAAKSPPFFTALAGTARPGGMATTPVVLTLGSGGGDGTTFSIPTDGQTATFQGGSTTQLVLGYGVETQIVTVDAVGPLPPTPNPGSNPNYPNGLSANQIGVLNLTRTAWGGTCVSNVRPGYAGPQPGFDYTAPKYKPVVPYVERLR